DDPRGSAAVVGNLSGTISEATLASVDGFVPGRVIRIPTTAAASAFVYRRISEVDATAKKVKWTTPITLAATLITPTLSTCEFRINARRRDPRTGQLIGTAENDWRFLTMDATSDDYVVTRVNHPQLGSKLVVIADLSA